MAVTFTNRSPDAYETDVAITTNIIFSADGTGFGGFNTDSLDVTIASRPAIASGVFQTSFLGYEDEGFTGSITDAGGGLVYNVVIDPDFILNYNTTYVVSLAGEGVAKFSQGKAVYEFTTTSITPFIDSAINGPYNNKITLTFGQDMTNNSTLSNPNNYQIRGDAYVSGVVVNSLSEVELTAENLYGQETFTVVVKNVTVNDAYSLPLGADSNSITVSLENPTDIELSGISGSLKTKNEINAVYGDDNYWYVGTVGGLDIVDNQTLLNTGYVIDAYGVDHVAADNTYVYYSNSDGTDAYGVFKIAIDSITGNSAGLIEAALYDVDLPSTTIQDMTTNDDTLIVATDNGAVVLRSDGSSNTYSSGSNISSAVMNDNEILYVANNTSGAIEVYYDTAMDGYDRTVPDFSYTTASTPAIVNGTINVVRVSHGTSSVNTNSDTLYVGTDGGVSVINTDNSVMRTSESNGISTTYGVSGSGLDYEILGGDTNKVTLLDVNPSQLQLFVLTENAGSSGGFNIINISSNASLRFIDEDDLPGTTRSDIFFKKLAVR